VDPAQCRAALSSIFSEQGRSQVNEMADASEALADVLEALNRAFKTHKASGDDPSAGESLISSSFALHYVEDMECEQCRYKMAQQKNNTFFHLAFTSQLTEVQNTSSHRLRPEQMLKMAYARESRECPRCQTGYNVPFTCSRHLSKCPNIFSLVLAWASDNATHQDIEALFKQLPLTLDLSEIYDLSEVGRTQYRLRCMVCFYGQHYVLLAYKPRVRQWVQYDDTSVKAIGDWTEVEKRCKAGRFQPNVVFFERY